MKSRERHARGSALRPAKAAPRPAPIPGNANDLDEQATAGSVVCVALDPDNTIVPFVR